MATLHIRSVPDDLHVQLQELARHSRGSLSAQVISLLSGALAAHQNPCRQAPLLDDIRRRYHPPAGAPDSTELLREDRER